MILLTYIKKIIRKKLNQTENNNIYIYSSKIFELLNKYDYSILLLIAESLEKFIDLVSKNVYLYLNLMNLMIEIREYGKRN